MTHRFFISSPLGSELITKASSEHVAKALQKASSAKVSPKVSDISEKQAEIAAKVSSQASKKKSSKEIAPIEDGTASSGLKKDPSVKKVASKKSATKEGNELSFPRESSRIFTREI